MGDFAIIACGHEVTCRPRFFVSLDGEGKEFLLKEKQPPFYLC